ncbi:hypothetical protein BDV95DRAFT_398611 [Massariosphaeria phaeospora]|uniref:Uncharacterized protein n=1 Tax=Massariosphaeria phaeospora TaxID=100035 RepID=A0A7C8MDT2_9PLEO|nr:hypothetical protein BDV95DRAFT_398611 [Massariosphaeria phaeospora]
MASIALQLEWNAGYGVLPFDIFVLDHWEGTALTSPVDNQQQWDNLARRYLSFPLMARWPLYKHFHDALSDVPGVAPFPSPTEEQIGGILVPHQSIQERNLSARCCSGWNTVWLRTCYAPSLADSPNHVLDDASLYDFEGSDQDVLDQLLLRLPGLTDAFGIMDEYGDGSLLRYASGLDDPEAIERAEHVEESVEIEKIALNIQNFVYVVDGEAVGKHIVKIWWFNEFGKIIWDNIALIPDTDLDGLLGAILDGQGFMDIVAETPQRGDVLRG